MARAKEILGPIAEPAAQATRELVLKAMHSVARRPVLERRPEQAKLQQPALEALA